MGEEKPGDQEEAMEDGEIETGNEGEKLDPV
jgi:hypothetical protein